MSKRVAQKEKELGKAPFWVAELYWGIAGLIETLRKEMHARFDRMERFVLPQYKRRVDKSERKK